ncbi:MAG: hypothetical protein N2606_03595 [Candidatus Omnitrophica bacterium]|nr:hypothetical protein [Candidatus Omnitrophota bacterium]
MRSKVYFLVGLILICFVAFSVAEDKTNTQNTSTGDVEPLPEWLYGEVVKVDTQAKTLVVSYIDFDKDIEKEITVNLDKQTSFVNFSSLEDIKPQDIVSIDYVVDSQGKNIALSISLEKPEDISESDLDVSEPMGELKDVQPQE